MEANIGIKSTDRKRIADGLSRFLADTVTLYFKTHAYHWNVEGPMFQTLHNMFMEQYNELWLATDEIAERIRALDFRAPGSYSELYELSSIKEDKGHPSASEMIRNLVEGHEAAARCAREVFVDTEGFGDQATLDLLTQRIRLHEKQAWMLRSLLRS